MSAFSKLVEARTAETRKAPRIATVPPSTFADDWKGKTHGPVQIGLRLLSDQDVQTVRAEAVRKAFSLHPHGESDPAFVEAHNDALMRGAVALATCRPEDVSKPFFALAEDVVWVALTPEGVRRLYEELEVLVIESSPLSPQATDDDIADLVDMLATARAWERMPVGAALRVRRLLGHVIEALAPYDPPEAVVTAA